MRRRPWLRYQGFNRPKDPRPESSIQELVRHSLLDLRGRTGLLTLVWFAVLPWLAMAQCWLQVEPTVQSGIPGPPGAYFLLSYPLSVPFFLILLAKWIPFRREFRKMEARAKSLPKGHIEPEQQVELLGNLNDMVQCYGELAIQAIGFYLILPTLFTLLYLAVQQAKPPVQTFYVWFGVMYAISFALLLAWPRLVRNTQLAEALKSR